MGDAQQNGDAVVTEDDALRVMAERIAALEAANEELIARTKMLHNRITDLVARGEQMLEAMSSNKFVQRMMMNAQIGG